MSARLAERGIAHASEDPELVVSRADRAIGEVAAGRRSGRGSHTSAAPPRWTLSSRTCSALGCIRCSRSRRRASPNSSTAPGAAVTAESDEARAVGWWLAETLGLRPFALADDDRAAYHAGAAMASNYLVTLRAAARSLLEAAGAPPEALDPLIRGVIDSGFELTGPIARGDWETVGRHLAVIRAERPELEQLYVTLAEATARIAGRDPAEVPA